MVHNDTAKSSFSLSRSFILREQREAVLLVVRRIIHTHEKDVGRDKKKKHGLLHLSLRHCMEFPHAVVSVSEQIPPAVFTTSIRRKIR